MSTAVVFDPDVYVCDTPGHENVTVLRAHALAAGWDIPSPGGEGLHPGRLRLCLECVSAIAAATADANARAEIEVAKAFAESRAPDEAKYGESFPPEGDSFIAVPVQRWAAAAPGRKNAVPRKALYRSGDDTALRVLYSECDAKYGPVDRAAFTQGSGFGPKPAISHEERHVYAPPALLAEQPTALIAVPQPQDAAPGPAAVYVPIDDPRFAESKEEQDAWAALDKTYEDAEAPGAQHAAPTQVMEPAGTERDAGRPHTAPMEAVGGEA